LLDRDCRVARRFANPTLAIRCGIRRPHWSAATVAVALLGGATSTSAQTPFGPSGAPPTSGAASPRVRGLYDPNAPTLGPAPSIAAGATAATFTPPVDRYGAVEFANSPARSVAAPAPIEGTEILARIDGQVILASDVNWQVDQMIATARTPVPPEQVAEARRMLSRQLVVGLIDTKLLYADFRRTAPAESLPQVEESVSEPFEEVELPRLMKVLKVNDRSKLEAVLKKHGTSLKDVERQFTERTIAGAWMQQRLPKPQPIAYEALLAYYQDHVKEYEFEAKVTWEELMARFDRHGGDRDATWRALCDMGNEVWNAAQANPGLRGPVFAAVAKAKSQGVTAASGGIHENMTLGALRCDAINHALATLEIGQMSDGIESDWGFHIVRVLKRSEAGRVPFTEAQAGIRKTLEAEQRTALLEAELKKLRSTAKVWTAFDGDLSGPRLSELLNEGNRRR
jgi:hypothetical protein